MKYFDKMFVALATVLIVWQLLIAGFYMGHHQYIDMVPCLVLGIFWLITLLVMQEQRVSSAKTDTRIEYAHDLNEIGSGIDELVKLIEDLKNSV